MFDPQPLVAEKLRARVLPSAQLRATASSLAEDPAVNSIQDFPFFFAEAQYSRRPVRQCRKYRMNHHFHRNFLFFKLFLSLYSSTQLRFGFVLLTRV